MLFPVRYARGDVGAHVALAALFFVACMLSPRPGEYSYQSTISVAAERPGMASLENNWVRRGSLS